MKTIARALVAAVLCAAPSLAAAEPCVKVAGRALEPSEIYSERHVCGTCPGQRLEPDLCATINRLMVPWWDSPGKADLVPIPHRGVWGMLPANASENTLNALKAAVKEGYHAIEIDVTFTGSSSKEPRTVFLGHYFSMASVGEDPRNKPEDYAPSQLLQFRQNKRNQDLSRDPGDALLSFDDALKFAKQEHVLLMVDPKDPEGANKDYLEQIIAHVLDRGRKLDALQNIAIKTTRSYADISSYLEQHLDDYHEQFEGRFLWSPIVATKPTSKDLTQTIDFINAWNVGTESSRQVVTYEINLFNPEYFGSKQFTISTRHGIDTYADLFDYLRRLTAYGKRSAIWSIDPMGDKGTFGRVYNWKFYGNTVDDKRGNPVTNLSYQYATFVAVNTDRPSMYRSFVKSPYK